MAGVERSEPPVRRIWGLVALDPSHPILILSRNTALVPRPALELGWVVPIPTRSVSEQRPGLQLRPRSRFQKMHTLQSSIGQRPLITVAWGIAPGIVCNWPRLAEGHIYR